MAARAELRRQKKIYIDSLRVRESALV